MVNLTLAPLHHQQLSHSLMNTKSVSRHPLHDDLRQLWANERFLYFKTHSSRILFDHSIWQTFRDVLQTQIERLDELAFELRQLLSARAIETPLASNVVVGFATLKKTFPSHPAVRVHAHALHVDHTLLHLEISRLIEETHPDERMHKFLASTLQLHEHAKRRLQYHR